MANLREIKKRINSVSTTEQITRTMEMVSTAKIGRALNREKQSEAYRRAITDVMLTVAGDTAAGPSSPLLVNPASYDCALLIVINSDRGLAGGFNVTVERAAEKRIDHFRRHGAQRVELITCGRKATEYFRHRDDVVMTVEGESDDPTLERARMIASYVCDGFASGRFGRVDIVYYHARNRVDQELRQERILPLDREVLHTSSYPAKAPVMAINSNALPNTAPDIPEEGGSTDGGLEEGSSEDDGVYLPEEGSDSSSEDFFIPEE